MNSAPNPISLTKNRRYLPKTPRANKKLRMTMPDSSSPIPRRTTRSTSSAIRSKGSSSCQSESTKRTTSKSAKGCKPMCLQKLKIATKKATKSVNEKRKSKTNSKGIVFVHKS
ncbi:hypothetical protein Droror1_Dr00000661 [Drosera rotundifolia]